MIDCGNPCKINVYKGFSMEFVLRICMDWLTFACMNLKKLARMKQRLGLIGPNLTNIFVIIGCFLINDKKQRSDEIRTLFLSKV